MTSNRCLIFEYLFDLLEVRCIKERIVFVQVVLVRVGTFQRANEAEHAAITINVALADI